MRRVLLDENLPRRLKEDLAAFEVRTVPEEGWAGLPNGEVLRQAEGSFDVFVTGDQNLPHQQHLEATAVGIVVIVSGSLRLADLRRSIEEIREAVERVEESEVRIVRL